MSNLAFLEAFDAAPLSDDPPGADITAAWQEGYRAAQAEAAEAGTSVAAEREARALQALDDMSFGFAEAQAAVMQNLAPLFEALMADIVPALAKSTLVPHILDHLMSASEADVTKPLILSLAPDDADWIADVLKGNTKLPFRCQADPALAPGQVIIAGDTHETMLDLATLTAGMNDILRAMTPQPTESHAHG